MQVADTSFLYALFSSTDHFHGRAREMANRAEGVLVPSEIYAETVSLILSRQGFAAARAAGEWIRAQEGIHLATASRALLDRAWMVFLQARGRLSYPDAVVLAWCVERHAEPLAFDEAILRYTRRKPSRRHRQRS